MGLLSSSELIAADSEEAIELEPVVVVASRRPKPLSEIAAQITVIDAADMESGMVEDLDSLFRLEPGLEVQTAGTRFGGESINVRGIAGNRVDVEIDGVPLADGFAIGAYSDAGRTLVETDRLKRVEVLHGPASAMHGSNALGGVVAFTTWDPSDLVQRNDGDGWLGLRVGYQGANDSWVTTAQGAWSDGTHGLLLSGTYREGHELDKQSNLALPSDPQDWDSKDLQLRYTFDTPGGNRLRLTAEDTRRNVLTDIHSLLGYGRRFRSTTLLQGDDEDQSSRYSLHYDFEAGQWENGQIKLYGASSETDQHTFELRENTSRPVQIERQFRYKQDMAGAEILAFRSMQWGNTGHRVGLGAEWLSSDTESMRDGLSTSLLTGESTHVILGEEMPVRDFPKSSRDELGVWVQDEIRLPGDRWELVPALRWDRYELDPRPDELWLEDNPDTPVVSIKDNRATPRLGLVFRPTETWSLYGQYTEGFRAPPPEDANIGFLIPLFGYQAIPNPDLKSETSTGLEFGLRRFTASSSLSLALFHTDYDDFIESRALIGLDPVSGYLIFQSRNIDKANIQGVDIRFQQQLGAWSNRLDGFDWRVSAYWSEGENRQTNQPLNSVAPPQLVNGIQWNSADAAWRVSLFWTVTAKKDRADIDFSDGERFATPSWQTVDLTASWRPAPRLQIRAGAFNLFDESYWRWLDVYHLSADDPMIPLLSRPGRNFSISLNVEF